MYCFFFSLFGFVVLASLFYLCLGFFFVLHGWMSHNGSPKVKTGAIELVAVGHGYEQ